MAHTPGQQEFDYIIIGAGSAGSVLAHRLLQRSDASVCVIEAGGPDRHPLIHIPFGLSLLSRVRSVNWGYHTAPQRQLNQRRLYWPRGKTLGGSSSVNAMCYIRGDARDYDHWAKAGAAGWDWQAVLPYFVKAEDQARGNSELHGVGGPLPVCDLRYHSPLTAAFIQSARTRGVPANSDFNGPCRDGVGLYQVTQRNGQRCSSARAYLLPNKDNPRLHILTHTRVDKILFKQSGSTPRAVGVSIVRDNNRQTLRCRQEVLLCGGAINSPQVLMLSGVGDQEALAPLGINPVAHVPGVGKNLQDHLDAIIQYRCDPPGGYGLSLKALPRYVQASWRYLWARQDLFSSNLAEGGAFTHSSLADGRADIQFHFVPGILHDHGRALKWGHGFGLHACGLYPKSRGQLTLTSADPMLAPHIDPNYLAHEDDLKVLREGIEHGRDWLAAKPFKAFNAKEVLPGPGNITQGGLDDFIRNKAQSIYHPIGTCKMGGDDDPMAVVDPDLRVRGVAALRVVDASVMPSLIGGNTHAPTVMIAEKAADLILTSQGA